MRSFHIATLLTILAVTTSAAQNPERESALGTRLRDYGGFVGLDMRFGDLHDDFAVFTGGHAALLLKHRIYLGVGGAGLTTDSRIGDGAASEDLHMGYGGFLVGYVVPLPGLVQLTADVLIGAGGARVGAPLGTGEELDDAFLAFEPTLGVELKLARVIRIGFGAGYRFVGGLDSAGLRDNDLRDLTVAARLRVGWF